MYEHNALGYRSGLALLLTKVRSSRACCPATALIIFKEVLWQLIYLNSCIRLIICENVYFAVDDGT